MAVQPDGQAVSGPVRGCELLQPQLHLPQSPRQEGAGHQGMAESHRGRHITAFGVIGPEFKRKRDCESSHLVRGNPENKQKSWESDPEDGRGNSTHRRMHARTRMHTRMHACTRASTHACEAPLSALVTA